MQSSQHDDLQGIRDELLGLRAELDARTSRTPSWRRGVTRLRSMRRLTAVGIVALLLALPVAVSASHVFSDVPNSNTFHSSIANLYGARITGGCGGGKYCPNASVTRGQMAAFLNRGLGRAVGDANITIDTDWAEVLPTGSAFVTIINLRSGGGAGGTGHALVQGNISAFTNEPGVCPCELALALLSEVGEVSVPTFTMIGSDLSPSDSQFKGATSMSHLFTVPSGVDVGYALIAQITPTVTPTAGFDSELFYSLQATYVPFDDQGGNPTLPITTSGMKQPFGKVPNWDR